MDRLQILFLFFSFIIFSIICRLFYIQVLSSDSYSSNNYLQTQRIQPSRGNIYDRNHEPLVINQASYLLYAEPENIDKPDNIIEKVDKILEVGEATLEARFDARKKWIPFAYDLNESEKRKVEKMQIKGLGFQEDSKRFYPEASIAAQVLGFVGKDKDGDRLGYFGIEGFYNKDLEGLPGILKTERDLLGRPIVIGTQDRLKGENGRDLVLTIDKTTQMIAKRRLKEGIERFRAQSGCITIADPYTGEIFAMTCLPDFDPVEYYKFSEAYFKNPVISDVFEPGSIFKPLIVAAALEEGKIDASDTYNEKGPIKSGKYYIRTWNDEYHGILTISEILQKSSNVGMVFIGHKLGDKNILKYLEKYGFGQDTHIDLQGEARTHVKPKSQWYPVEYSTVTFGQGIAVTQMQILTAFSALINDGWIVKPHVVKETISENGNIERISPKKVRRILSTKTSNIIKKMLYETVLYGEAKWHIPEGYKIGGKTGTAQIPVQGTYDPSKTNASFIGFAPLDKPKFIVLVTLHQPEASPWASETAAPLFFSLAKDLLVQYNIVPD